MRFIIILLAFASCSTGEHIDRSVDGLQEVEPMDIWHCDESGTCVNQDTTKMFIPSPKSRRQTGETTTLYMNV